MNKTLFLLLGLCCAFSVKAQSEYKSGTIQIGVVVANLDQSMDFYQNVLGMKKVSDFEVNSDLALRTGLTGGIPFKVEVLKLIDEPQATEYKLMSFGKKAQHHQQKWIQDDTGVQYITINVNDLKPFIERFDKNDIRLLGETPTEINDQLSFILIQDPDGNFIELIGPKLE
jgi:catechol 2,3-dioxygenase-like lactoylglutathione lyase family enzyme